MQTFGGMTTNDKRVNVPTNYSFPTDPQPKDGDLHLSSALHREGLHFHYQDSWKQLALLGDLVYFEALLRDPITCYSNITTKLPLTFSKKDYGYNHTKIDTAMGRFIIENEQQAGVYMFFGQAYHNATHAKLIITKGGNSSGVSFTSNGNGHDTLNTIAIESANVGDYFEMYFETKDDECKVFNDFYTTKLVGVKIK